MPLSVVDLAFEAADVVAREVFFLEGSVSLWRDFFRRDAWGKADETLSVNSRALNESTKV